MIYAEFEDDLIEPGDAFDLAIAKRDAQLRLAKEPAKRARRKLALLSLKADRLARARAMAACALKGDQGDAA